MDAQQLCEACKQSGTNKAIGTLNFCIKCLLGERGSGEVFKGKFKGITDDVAVKRIKKMQQETLTNTDEWETLSRISGHPNVVRYYTTEQDDDYWFVNINDKENNLIFT